MYTKVHKTSFNGQGLTRKDNCFHGLLKDWTAAMTCFYIKLLIKLTSDHTKRFSLCITSVNNCKNVSSIPSIIMKMNLTAYVMFTTQLIVVSMGSQ